MDFRDPNTVGTFVYHCHLLEHEDGGMMGVIRVVPKGRANRSSAGNEQRPLCRLAIPIATAIGANFIRREESDTMKARKIGQILTRVSSGNNNARVSTLLRAFDSANSQAAV